MKKLCELCNAQAFLYCSSDSAFLCYDCDAKVHQANFLVARHLRYYLCANCTNITLPGFAGPGGGFYRGFVDDTCSSCPSPYDDDDGDLDSISSSSSSCISSTTAEKSERMTSSGNMNAKVEGIFVNWCCKLGVGAAGLAVRMACKAMRVFLDGWTILPFRVCLAASMWLGLRFAGEKWCQLVLNRLEDVSGVPAKIILATEGKVERALRQRQRDRRRRLEQEEGWAES